MPENCPVCNSADCNVVTNFMNNVSIISCARCGTFQMGRDTIDDLPTLLHNKDIQRMLLSHKILKSQLNNNSPLWNHEHCENVIRNDSLPNIADQTYGALEWIANKSKFPGDNFDVSPLEIEAYAGTINAETVGYSLRTLKDMGLIDFRASLSGHHSGYAALTFSGWEKYNELIAGKLSNRKAFMAMKFGDPLLDRIVNEHFRPALLQAGFTLTRLDDRPEAGLIDIRLRQEIKSSQFLIADLSHDNLGAYWEAGFAEGAGKRVIYTCNQNRFAEAKTHFDVNHQLTIVWDENNIQEAVTQLKAAIRYTFPEAKQEDN
jgi:Zn ribbon nucleic-acid-binding protein